MSTLEITIDGKTCTCEKGEYLLDVALRNGIYIPSLCKSEDLEGRGACRVCIVEIDMGEWSKIVASCLYPIDKECVVYTNSERIKRDRAMILALLREEAPDSEVIAKMAEEYNAPTSKRFKRNMENKCILCGLCVRACKAAGASAITMVERGTDKRLTTPYDEPSADCTGCASCASVCPTGYIVCMQDDEAATRTIWGRTFDLVKCSRCGTLIDTRENIEASLRAGEVDESNGTAGLCDECKRRAVADDLAEAHGHF